MLHLYQSNRLEDLYVMLSSVMRLQPLSNPFAREMVVVQSKGMGRWLNFRLATECGIAANMAYPLPASFFWDVLNKLLGEQQRRSPFSPDILTFRILRWLETPMHLESAPMLRDYLEGKTAGMLAEANKPHLSEEMDAGKAFRRYALAVRLADIFDQYLVYRPDWLAAWEAGVVPVGVQGRPVFDTEHDPESIWQAMLWRALSSEVQQEHRAHSLAQLKEKLDRGEGIERLPERVTLVGISNLPPVYMDILKHMAKHIDVLFFAINPCAMPWGDIRDVAEQERYAGDRDPSDLYLEVGHPLLASWGKQGRDFFDSLVEEAELHSVFDCSEPEDGTLLQMVQHDILMLHHREDQHLYAISEEDRSIQVHVCHSAMREVEVLHDQLLARFNACHDLLPSEVVVLTPDIETYAPLVEAVFAVRSGTPTIPYSIADRSETHYSVCVQTFLEMLNLPESRFEAEWVIALLDTEAVRCRFELELEDKVLIRRWVEQTHICWGKDAQHKSHFGLPETPQNAWREGLSRLMLGIALPCAAAGDSVPLYEGILPYDDIEGQNAWVAARFSAFVETLFEQAERLARPAPLAEWSIRLHQLLEALFKAERDEDIAMLHVVREKIELLHTLQEEASYSHLVEAIVIRSWMANELEAFSSGGGFLTGGVTFCTMVPMRSLPFKMICVLGMQEGAFPRLKRPLGFDLMARHPRRGDRARRADDRFLFLETVLSARHTFYISYIGKDIRTDNEQPPSVLVSDLLDTIASGFILEKDGSEISKPDGRLAAKEHILQHVRCVHPLQPFSSRYFLEDSSLRSYSESWCRAAVWGGRGRRMPQGIIQTPLPEPEEEWKSLDINTLFEALIHPTRYLMKERYGFTKPQALASLPTTEPFDLDFSATQMLRDQSWSWVVAEQLETAASLARAQGILPHGLWGDRLHEKECTIIQQVHEQAEEWMKEPVLPSHFWKMNGSVSLGGAGLSLSGYLDQLRPSGLLVVLPQKFYTYHKLSVWLQHLALSYSRPPGVQIQTRIVSEEGMSVFRLCEDPERILNKLLNVYWSSLRNKILLFKKTSSAFAEQRIKTRLKKSEEEALEAALGAASKAWHPQFQWPGEWEEDAWLAQVWQGIDPTQGEWQSQLVELAECVWEPLFEHLE